jgi:DNA mismatch repair ATPase MutL
LSIKFAAKLTACLVLAGSFTFIMQAQQTMPPNSDSSPQTQSQDSTSQSSQAPASPKSAASASDTQNSSSPSQTSPPQDSSAQTPSSQQAQSQTQSQQDTDKNKSNPGTGGKVAGTSNDRLFYALPNFLSLQNSGPLPPLSTKDKFKVVALGTFDYINYPWWGIISAIDQAADSDRQYRQGWLGYAKRYGTTAGDSIIENFMVGAVFPSVLHQDPRFYQSSDGGAWHRTGYAISRIFVTHSDSHRRQFNFSEIFGAGTAAAISTYTYHPGGAYIGAKYIPSERTFDDVISTWGTQLSLDTATIIIKEFWPDIHRKLSRKHHQEATNPSNQ